MILTIINTIIFTLLLLMWKSDTIFNQICKAIMIIMAGWNAFAWLVIAGYIVKV